MGGPPGTQPDPPPAAKEAPEFSNVDEVDYPASSGTPVTITVDPSIVNLPDASITVEATNHRGRTFLTSFYQLRLHKYVAGKWWYLGPFEALDQESSLGGGESHMWELTVVNRGIERHPKELSPSSDSTFTLRGIGEGLYAFSIQGRYGRGGPKRAFVTPFEVSGETVKIVPMAEVEANHQGDRITVKEVDPLPGIKHEVTARRRKVGDDTVALVPEWGLRQDGIRNTAPFFSNGVQTVVYTKFGAPVYPGIEIDGRTFEYRGYSIEYELREV